MDDIIKDVNEGWDEEGKRTHFRGSDDYLRQKVSEIAHESSCLYLWKKFEEYISGALASIKQVDFVAKGKANDVVITEGESNLCLDLPS